MQNPGPLKPSFLEEGVNSDKGIGIEIKCIVNRILCATRRK